MVHINTNRHDITFAFFAHFFPLFMLLLSLLTLAVPQEGGHCTLTVIV